MSFEDLPFEPEDLPRVERELSEIATRLAERFHGTFTPATVERYVFESYQALAASARLAAFLPALTERFADDRLVALASELELGVIEAMAEIGADLSAEYPKPLTDEFVQAADIVITVGCGDARPVLPGKRYLDWTVPDPEDQDMVEVRRIRDELDFRATDLLTYLPDADGAPDDPKGTSDV